MKMHKIKLFLVTLCSGFSMLGLASDDMNDAERIYKEVFFRVAGGVEFGRIGRASVYEGMSYYDLYACLATSLRISLNADIVLKATDNQRTVIELTNDPYKLLQRKDLTAMSDSLIVNVFSLKRI